MTFEKPGKANTVQALELAVKAAREEGITKLVVASGSGETLAQLEGIEHEGLEIIGVTYVYGYRAPEGQPNRMSEQDRAAFEQRGIKLVTAAHVLSGAERALATKFSGIYPIEIAAHALRMLGAGVKVCIEIGIMAADAGAVGIGEAVVAVAGTAGGADTAVVIRPSISQTFLDTKVDRIICKPRLF